MTNIPSPEDVKVNPLTPEPLVKFRDATIPEVKKVIVEKHGAEGEAMMKAFLEAVEAASKVHCRALEFQGRSAFAGAALFLGET